MSITVTYEMMVAAFSSIIAVYKAICWFMDRYDIGEKRKQAKLMKKANMFMMCEIIRMEHKDSLRQGYIEEDDLQHVEHTYEVYKALGGNGTAERWMHDLRKLPRQMDKIN